MSDQLKAHYTLEEIAEIIRDAGYKAQIQSLQNGKRMITSAASGLNFMVWAYGPNETELRSVQFVAPFKDKLPLEALNKVNNEWRFGRAYADSDGELTLEMDCIIANSTPQLLKEALEGWTIYLAKAR